MKKQIPENDVLLERINNLIETNKSEHSAILIQTTRTNGRVNKLELWQNRIIGGMIIVDIIVIPIVLYWITKIV
jgi:hypothetical protein